MHSDFIYLSLTLYRIIFKKAFGSVYLHHMEWVLAEQSTGLIIVGHQKALLERKER